MFQNHGKIIIIKKKKKYRRIMHSFNYLKEGPKIINQYKSHPIEILICLTIIYIYIYIIVE